MTCVTRSRRSPSTPRCFGRSDNTPQGHKFLVGIGDAVGEMHGMIGDLLDFTRTRLGDGIPIRRTPADIEKLGRELVEKLRVAHPTRTFELNVAGDLAIACDGARLRQALANLIGNACKHGGADGPITLTLDGTDAQSLTLAIHNSGKTIPANGMTRIFDPMARGQSDDASVTATSGVGLGLFIAREVALSHGGTIEAKSAADAGTTFTIHLPRQTSAPRR